jgi:hypothetical protein
MGQNVTVWEEGQYETSRKNVTSGRFVAVKNGWSNCHSYITSILGLGGRKILGCFIWRRYVTVDIVNQRMLRWVDVLWESKRY